MVHFCVYSDWVDILNLQIGYKNSPSTLQSYLDLHHDRIEEGLHVASNGGRRVANGNEC